MKSYRRPSLKAVSTFEAAARHESFKRANADFFASEAGKALISRVPQCRLGELTELDGPLLLLASDAASFMTGAVIPVDGVHLVNSL